MLSAYVGLVSYGDEGTDGWTDVGVCVVWDGMGWDGMGWDASFTARAELVPWRSKSRNASSRRVCVFVYGVHRT